jgi:hypothetical protein
MDAVPLKNLIKRRDGGRHGIAGTGSLYQLRITLLTIAALHQGNYATIYNYLERELRYMDAGE